MAVLGTRRLWRWIGGGLLAFLLAVLAIPSLISHRFIYEPFVRSLAQDKLHLEVESVRLGWISPVEFKGLVVSDLENSSSEIASNLDAPKLLRIKSFKTGRSLLGHLFSGKRLGTIEIDQPEIDISIIEDSSNLQRLIESLKRAQGGGASGSSKQNVDIPVSQAPDAVEVQFPAVEFDFRIQNASVQVKRVGDSAPLAVIPPFSVAGKYRGLSDEPSLQLAPTKLLDHVQITQELVRLGLGKAVPLMAKSTWFEGSVSLDSGEIHIPLKDPAAAVAAASLQMHEVKTGPSEPLLIQGLEMIAKLRDKPASLELVFMNESIIEIELADKRVHHSGLQAGLPKIDERLQVSSTGSVGVLDRSLELSLEIPVPVEQLARRETVREIGVPRIQIPVRGTLDHPEIEWESMRSQSGAILALMSGKLQEDAPVLSSVLGTLGGVAEGDADEAINATIDVIQSIREARRKAREEAAATSGSSNPSSEQEPSRRRRPILDALRQALEE